jgi:alpha-L-fucosidase
METRRGIPVTFFPLVNAQPLLENTGCIPMKYTFKIGAGLFAVAAGLLSGCKTAPSDLSKMVPPMPAQVSIAPGKFQPNWESLETNYECPEWFRDAKFGIWAHWSAQCVPEQGDWYARKMYMEGDSDYKYHLAHYGPQSQVGFKDIDNMWHAEHWDPDAMMQLYKAAGAKYFMALANHHDNFDTYDSKWQPWNSVNIGPHKDIIGIWAKTARKYGLRFAVSNHSSHTWHWFQVAYGYDTSGPYKDVPYDGWLTRADGKGKWWDGYDPQDLYGGPREAPPKGLDTQQMTNWISSHYKWHEEIPPDDNGYSEKWYLRCQDLVDKYHPDMVYFDDTQLPLGKYGLDIAADFYNANASWHGGKEDAVITAKLLTKAQRDGIVEDYERGSSAEIQPRPWETDTCIGGWHYDRSIYEQHRYKTVDMVVKMLVNIVSKNGNLMLNIPVRGDGSIDSDEVAFLHGMAAWMSVNGEGIFATRPWKVYGEGPPPVKGGMFNEKKQQFSAKDIRFTQTKDGRTLYAFFLGWPSDGKLTIHSLGQGVADKPALLDKNIESLTLLGSKEKIQWTRDADGLHIDLPATAPCKGAFAVKLKL